MNSKNNIYAEGSKIKTIISMDPQISSKKAKFMAIFLLRDNSRVAMSESDFFHIEKGSNSIYADIPLDCFVNDEY
ncbi:MAG: hypothetical protein LIP01_10970, partial [Tannerellaceae bacterium]|nr:hypothetical protein [Tannerellaceae bacterium]